jgi:hypothetical protein
VGDLISRLKLSRAPTSYKYSGSLLENHLFLNTVFLRNLFQSCLTVKEKSVRNRLIQHLSDIMTTPGGSQVDPSAEINLSSRTRISAMIRESWAQSAKEDGNDNSLWEDVFWPRFVHHIQIH